MAYNNSEQHASGGGGDDNMQDPSAGGLFNVNYKKHEDLKNMLDQNKDALKLEAMKRIIGMIAKGKNASMLFPAVVKNVACKNIEVKKLVYVYLERYAEEQQDLALLSISTFQRGLKDSNQMIRASALRVLSSIRVPIIVPIMLLAIKEGVNDMCAFVRKTAAHAIPKLYSLDPEQKENLIEIIDKMLSDRTTLVAGSVVMAYQEVCPDRIDLVHRHFRNLCSLLVDVDEWGQIAIISMLTRYARTQFTDPNRYDAEDDSSEKPFYDDDDDEEEDEKPAKEKAPKYVMDADHRLLLKSTKSLVQSRNAAVVMSVAQLYYHLAPRAEMSVVVKALIRLLRGRREVQAIVLQNIASITLKRKGIFGPYLKSFYVRSSDPTHVRVLKLEVLTNLASESNIAVILREFQTYVRSSDKQFVAHTIQAIARCATDIQEVTDTCLAGLVSLLSNRDESVVAESVVVIKKLLQMNPSQHSDIIKRTARLLDQIQVPMARASILWLIGEYSEFVPRIAPDVLRKEAKHFTAQEDIVKLQVVNLAAKLYLTNHKQTKLLTQYVLQLAKYDQNYDIRDRARFIRHLIMPSADPDTAGISFHKYAKKILLAAKPAPVLESPFTGRDAYQLGSLSHVLNGEAQGYQRLPDFPETQPDPTVRNVEIPKIYEEERAPTRASRKSKTPLRKPKSFYSDEEESSEEEEDTESDDDDESESKSESSEESSSSETEGPDSRISDSDNVVVGRKSKCAPKKAAVESTEESEDSEEDSESGTDDTSSDASDSSSSEEEEEKKAVAPPPRRNAKAKSKPAEVNLLDLDDFLGGAPPAASAPGPFLTPTVTADLRGLSLGVDGGGSDFTIATASPQTTHQLLHRVTGEGLAATYRFTRQPYKADEKMISVEIEFTNHGHSPICNLTMGNKKLQHGLRVGDFDEIESVQPGATVTAQLGVDFCDTTQPLVFDLVTKTRKFNVSIKIPVGELVRPFATPQTDFLKQKASLAGMNETKCRLQADSGWSMHSIAQKVIRDVNVCRVPSTQEQVHRFAGKTAHGGSALLITIDLSASRGGSGADSSSAELSVNCEKMVIGSMIFTQLKENLVV